MTGRAQSPAWRAYVAVAGVLALVGVVAVAATGRSPGGGESRPGGQAPTLLIDYIATLALLLVPAGAVLIIWASFVRRGYEAKTGKRHRSGLWSFAFLALVVAVFTLGRGHFDWHPLRDPPSAAGSGTGESKKKESDDKSEPYQAQFRLLPLVVLGSVVLGFAGTMGVLAWRRKYVPLETGPTPAMLAEVLTETLDDLLAEPDPRKAVIGAYAKMERTLAARGVPREEHEAPVEYLERVLDVVQPSSHSVRRLTQLFERARFSPHEIDERMKQDAIEALIALRTELEAAT